MRDFFIFSLMRKKINLAAVVLSMIFLSCGHSEVSKKKNATQLPQKTQVESAILEEDISETLRYLSSDELQGRKVGTEGIEKAAQYIEEQFTMEGIAPYFETYRRSFSMNGIEGHNIVAFKEGTDPAVKDQVIIIGAHYDHLGLVEKVDNDSIANGANDNASGTTAVLELAKFFSTYDTKRSLLFALFSAEESGLVGSSKLADKLLQQNLDPYIMFNIEMIGVPMQNKNYLAYITGFDISNLPQVFNDYAGEKILGFLPEAEELNLYQRSDNYAFAKKFNIPAHSVSSFDFSNYDYYHHVDDEFEKLDTAYMEKFIEAMIPPLAGIANATEKKVKLN